MFDISLIQRGLRFDASLTRVSRHVKLDMVDIFGIDASTCQTVSTVCQYVKKMFDGRGAEKLLILI